MNIMAKLRAVSEYFSEFSACAFQVSWAAPLLLQCAVPPIACFVSLQEHEPLECHLTTRHVGAFRAPCRAFEYVALTVYNTAYNQPARNACKTATPG